MAFACDICGKTSDRCWKRCAEHYRCDDCGTRESLCTYCEGVLCDVCHRARVEKRIADFNESTHYTEQIVCPHCGYKVGDSWEVSEGRQQCEDCQNEYDVERIVDVTYSTTKLTGA